MPLDGDLLHMLEDSCGQSDFTLSLGNNTYDLEDAAVRRDSTPVTEPTTRGGAYFSEKFAHRISGTVRDLGIIPLLSKAMLGPSAEFGDICIRMAPRSGDDVTCLEVRAHLTSSVQKPSGIELHMMLVGISRC